MQENLKTARLLGVTPLLLRLAWDYAKRGIGTHYISHKEYDNVVVSEAYPWTVVGSEGAACLRVAFKRGTETVRYIELGVHGVGAGGMPTLTEVP